MSAPADGGGTWAIVLAAGDGTRLRGITTDAAGRHVPKQFWAVGGRASLLDRTLARAARLVPEARAVTIVAERHRRWWQEVLRGRPTVIQPANRGTAAGILLAALCVLERDPKATLLVLPSDHWVEREEPLARAARRAVLQLHQHPRRLLLLGVAPETADAELGYIVPAPGAPGAVQPVQQFVEKPGADVARRLLRQGALWNSFILAVRGPLLLHLFERFAPATLTAMRHALRGGLPLRAVTPALRAAYESLPDLDFSRSLLQPAADLLGVVRVPPCGWTDLGAPSRMAGLLAAASSGPARPGLFRPAAPSLAQQGA